MTEKALKSKFKLIHKYRNNKNLSEFDNSGTDIHKLAKIFKRKK